MRTPGLRLQLLLLLGGLLLLTFVPLQLALSTYTQVTLRRLDDQQAHALAQTIAAYVRRAQTQLAPSELAAELARDTAGAGLLGALIGDAKPAPVRLGDPKVTDALARLDAASAEPRALRVDGGRVLALSVPGPPYEVRLGIDAERSSARGRVLSRTFGLYAFLMATGLLTLAYFALTRLIVRPLDALSAAAQNVTLGSQKLDVPPSNVRELAELGTSLKRMTDRLLSEEESLRNKIAEVERKTVELTQAQSQLFRSERLASVGRLAAGLAHEIGNPIAAVMGLQELLLAGDLSPSEQRDFIQRMQRETERIHRTLKDLLAFARPAREAASPSHVTGDVEAAVHDTAALVVHQSSMRELELAIDVYPGLPRVTLATEQLVQVLLNLILNAADALSGQRDGKISVTARSDGDRVEIAVQDNGPGVPQELVDQIFEPFFTTKDVGKGTGLGLSVCQGLTAAAGGSMSLDASIAEGARFVIHLPIATEALAR